MQPPMASLELPCKNMSLYIHPKHPDVRPIRQPLKKILDMLHNTTKDKRLQKSCRDFKF
jgi:hypothetical protein